MEEIVAMLIQCQMSKSKVQIKFKIQMLKKECSDIKSFDIHLLFACLRGAASAKAGTLIFGIFTFNLELFPR
jgi:hypothetical protein